MPVIMAFFVSWAVITLFVRRLGYRRPELLVALICAVERPSK